MPSDHEVASTEASALASFEAFRERLRQGDSAAAQRVFETYAEQLIAIVKSRMDATLAQKIDPEDIVQSAFRSFFAKRAIDCDLHGWDGLLGMLIRITHRKCSRQRARFAAVKRSTSRELADKDGDLQLVDWATDVRTPTVAEALELQETIDLVMAQLDPDAKTVFQLRLQGHDPSEISESINRTERTVRRKLSSAREVLLHVLSNSP